MMKLAKCIFIRGGGELCARILALSVAVTVFQHKAAAVEDLTVVVGESVTLSSAAQYGTINIEGDLSVTGGKTVSVSNVNMTAGSITITGNDSTLGKAHGKSGEPFATTLSMTNDTNGVYGKILVKDTGVDADTGLAVKNFKIMAEGENFVSDNGYFDFLSLDNGVANFFGMFNDSSYTGRITVAGTSAMYRRQPETPQAIFRRGAYRVVLVDDTTLTFNFSAQSGYLNDNDCVVDIGGKGEVHFKGSHEVAGDAVKINRGAWLNHVGPIVLVRTDNKRNCYFALNDSNIIGPNVTALKQTSGSSSYDTQIKIATGVVISLCGDVQITGTRAYLTGGKIKIDATEAERSLKCNIKSGDSLVVEKVGANEMVVSATTNISNLVVSEGAVRFEGGECVVSNLTMAAGTTLIADGSTVMIDAGEYVGVSFKVENGGKFVKTNLQRTVIYDPVSMTGNLHVANGELVFSKYGFDQKWWRWTFKKVYNGPQAYIPGRFFLFNTNGDRICNISNSGYKYYLENDDASDIAKGRVIFQCSPNTNINITTSTDHQQLHYLPKCFRAEYFVENRNNFPRLVSPVVDPGNENSWISVIVRLTDAAGRLTGYNMATSLADRYATDWCVDASYDGKMWETIETRSDVVHKHPGNAYYYYDGYFPATGTKPSELFHFTGYRHGGLAVMDPLSVQVDEEATLDLLAFDEGQPIDAITIDFASGAGTVKGGKIVANGTLTLLNVEECGINLDDVLPIVFDGTIGTDNFASWTVIVDGRTIRRKISYSNGRITVPPAGLVIMVK